jgi:hypothetical protein
VRIVLDAFQNTNGRAKERINREERGGLKGEEREKRKKG